MAKIKGIQLKAIQEGIGHDFAGFQANIYLNNRYVGVVIDDGWGGSLQIHIERFELAFSKIASTYQNEDGVFTNEEALIFRLKELNKLEKDFKKAVKRGYSMIAKFDYYPRDKEGKIDFTKPFPYPLEETYLFADDKALEKTLEEKKPTNYQVYRSLDDFIIN